MVLGTRYCVTLPSFTEKYNKSGAVISAVPLCHGIGALIGLKLIVVEGAQVSLTQITR
jgi:2,3-bisphosphoglycerate-independent phosphoglycerate mutase